MLIFLKKVFISFIELTHILGHILDSMAKIRKYVCKNIKNRTISTVIERYIMALLPLLDLRKMVAFFAKFSLR
jgi:hypothetical protein